MRKVLSVLVLAGAASLAACEDHSGGRPADQGAGRPDTAGAGTAETPALEVMEGMGVGGTPAPGAVPLDTARMQDTAVVDATGRVDGR